MDIEKLWREFAAASIRTKDPEKLADYRRVFCGGMIVGLTQAAEVFSQTGLEVQCMGLAVIGELECSVKNRGAIK